MGDRWADRALQPLLERLDRNAQYGGTLVAREPGSPQGGELTRMRRRRAAARLDAASRERELGSSGDEMHRLPQEVADLPHVKVDEQETQQRAIVITQRVVRDPADMFVVRDA